MVGTTLSVLPYAMAGSGLNPDMSLSDYGQFAMDLSGSYVNNTAAFNPIVADLNQQANAAFAGTNPYPTLTYNPIPQVSTAPSAPNNNLLYPTVAALLLASSSNNTSSSVQPTAIQPAASSPPPTVTQPATTVTVVQHVENDDDQGDREVNGAGKRPPGWDKGVGNPHGDRECGSLFRGSGAFNGKGDHGNQGGKGDHGGGHGGH